VQQDRLRQQFRMPPAINVDLKVSFELFDMEPGSKGRMFIRNLLLHGGHADARGFSYADTYLRQDEGAIDGVAFVGGAIGPGGASPMSVAYPAAPAARSTAVAARRARVKNGFEFITRHISDEATLSILGDMMNPLFQDAAEVFDWIKAQVWVNPDTAEIQDMNIEWYQIEFMSVPEIGSSENTVKDAIKILRLRNAERPTARQFTNDEVAEKLLMMIKNGSKTFSESAGDELNRVEGVPGQPNVRRFQDAVPALPAPGGGPAPRPRNVLQIVNHYHSLYRDAVKHGRIPIQAARKLPKANRMMHVEDTLPREPASMMAEVARSGALVSPFAASTAGRSTSPTASLAVLQEAGFSVGRGTVTTTDFSVIGAVDIARAVTEGGAGDGFDLELCFDANDTAAIEIDCNNCRGLGHRASDCSSKKRFRSFQFVISILRSAEARAEERGKQQGHAPGGRRPLPRGQKQPFRQQPRRFTPTAAPRPQRYVSAQPRARSIEEMLPEVAPLDDAASETGDETGSAATELASEKMSAGAERTSEALAARSAQVATAIATEPEHPAAFGLSDAGYYRKRWNK
jgi:hypothetical protein